MSNDTMELLKVLAAVILIFAATTLAMLYGIALLAQYGADLPMIGSLPLALPPEMIPLLAESRLFTVLGAVHVMASGFALLLSSRTIDMALLITSKAATVVICALLGFAGGHLIYLQLTENTPLALSGLTPALIALAAFLVLSSMLSVPSLRQLGTLRFPVGIGLVILGPALLLWL